MCAKSKQQIKVWIAARFAMVLLAITAVLSPAVSAQDEGEAEVSGETVGASAIYIPLKPAFVVNYGGVGRLKYIKAEISIRVSDAQSANAIRHHMPYIRNNIVLLLSSQTEESIETMEGKELLRQAALEEVHKILAEEQAADGVVDLYFDNFIVQR